MPLRFFSLFPGSEIRASSSAMKFLKEDFSELQIGSSAESLQKSLDAQRELLHSQIDQLQRIVVTQCKLTGVNPLSQEMAAGALSIKIGKRPRDLLNPKALKYMQSVFSIKDAISKKECREISALFGVTVTQVREFFASQRSRVRKFVRLSREKAIKSSASSELHDGVPTSSDPFVPIDPVPLNTIGPTNVEETRSCSNKDDTLPGIDALDKQFVENIFSLMRKEETFSGQVKLMEWILRIQNSAVLCWFLNNGGVMVLATWLSQAAAEEQTSVLLVILNVLCHLPLHKALPVHMSAILQSVNRLRFYRTSDISNRARVLLSKWSKLLARSEAMKKLNGVKSSGDEQQELILKNSLNDVIADESWQSNIDTPEKFLDNSENFRISETTQALKLLPASSDDSNKKHILGVSSSQIRERRKVQLVDQPGQKTAGRSPQATRAAPLNQSRPMSADDIQKAKLRAQFMQSKYKKAISSNENNEVKTEGLKTLTSQPSILPSVSKVPVRLIVEEHKKPVPLPMKAPNMLEASIDSKPRVDLKEPLWEKCRRVQISWQTPPEVKLSPLWRVSNGENSKEVEVQKNRNRREKETVYRTIHEIPSNPKEPWDLEMDFDDTLTPVIPIEQSPDADGTETQAVPNHGVNNAATHVAPSQRADGSVSTLQVGNPSTAEPDLELLAVLLKNPELVFALTSGQAANLSSEDTVKLLDLIKAGGAGSTSSFNGINKQVEQKVEVSLPSPTPPSNPGTSGWRLEAARNPFSQVNRVAESSPLVTAAELVGPQMSAPYIGPPQQPATTSPAKHQYSLPQVPEKHASLHHISLNSSSTLQTNSHLVSAQPLHNFHSSLRVESASNIKSAHISTNAYNAEERRHIAIPPTPLVPILARPQTHQQSLQHHRHHQHQHQQQQQPIYSESYLPAPAYSKEIGKPSYVPDSWSTRLGLPSNYNPHLANQNNSYDASPFGGPVQPPQSQWEGSNVYAEGEEYESWSPDNSPIRNREYQMGRNLPEPRINSGRGYRPDQSRMRHSSGYRDHNRHGNRRWRDRRR